MRMYSICTAKSRQDNKLINKKIDYQSFINKLNHPVKTSETLSEYSKMNGEQKANVKDVGGFICGKTIDGTRKKGSIVSRSMISLDADNATNVLIKNFNSLCPWLSCMYSTHSHKKINPRMRIIIPLDADIKSNEYEMISQYIASLIGIKYFDECSFRSNQLMYWPSISKDAEYIFQQNDGNIINSKEILNTLRTNQINSKTFCRFEKGNSIAKDPLNQKGIIREFNRKYYPITKALDELIPGTYIKAYNNRYKYHESNNLPGVLIKDNSLLYSFHAKDPACGKLCSAFDIVRIHKFGDMGSFNEMLTFAKENLGVSTKEKSTKKGTAGNNWLDTLDRNKSGEITNRIKNISKIINKDSELKNFRYNVFSNNIEVTGKLPWRDTKQFWTDSDFAQLSYYLDNKYGRFSAVNIETAFKKCADDRSYHPVMQYLVALPEWDGINRVDTLFIDYLGAEDNIYTRQSARLMLMAAIRRILNPGVKFDYITVLNGPQGIGKSTLLSKLGEKWFSDSLSISDMNDKTAAEKLIGNWILEISEMAGMKKGETEKVKAFISRREDKYRKAYGRVTESHLRQCVFFGTTNSETGFLRDTTGNRRYLNIKVSGKSKYKPWNLNKKTINQIWAEARLFAVSDLPLYLDRKTEKLALKAQREAMEYDERQGIVEKYLDMYVPPDWCDKDLFDRREYFSNYKGLPEFGDKFYQRNEICNLEIWCECFNKSREDIKPIDTYRISAIMERVNAWHRSDRQTRMPLYGKQRIYIRNKNF